MTERWSLLAMGMSEKVVGNSVVVLRIKLRVIASSCLASSFEDLEVDFSTFCTFVMRLSS